MSALCLHVNSILSKNDPIRARARNRARNHNLGLVFDYEHEHRSAEHDYDGCTPKGKLRTDAYEGHSIL